MENVILWNTMIIFLNDKVIFVNETGIFPNVEVIFLNSMFILFEGNVLSCLNGKRVSKIVLHTHVQKHKGYRMHYSELNLRMYSGFDSPFFLVQICFS